MIIQDVLKQFGEDLKQYARTEAIFGDPIEVQGSTIVPVCRMSVGYGGGGGEGEGQDEKKGGGKGVGGGAGGGIKIEPAALIVAKDGDVSVVAIGAKESKLSSLIEMIPEAVEKFISKDKEESEEAEEETEEESE